MTNNQNTSSQTLANDQFGRQIAARLNESTDQLPRDYVERLRAARVQAVEKRKQVMQLESAALTFQRHHNTLSATHGGGHSAWWNRLGSVGLLLVLMVGLMAINVIQDDLKTRELADIDAAILIDDLPPAAYLDVGFAQYLKAGNRQQD